MREEQMYVCDDCNGSKKDNEGDMCLQCEGTGAIDLETIHAHNQKEEDFIKVNDK